ncbi:hypothetical protein [Clostridium sp. Ade.TY]|uniref:hypothetical protein n=1 Tax=Clostridium sp. Ade.TY TaxID=1391647 RepID=UPI0004252258|nr:hypothetical protein [Clostridium sp. Ade.TY]
MSKKAKYRGNSEKNGFSKFMNGFKNLGSRRGSPFKQFKNTIFFWWFTPAKCIVCGAMVCALLLFGVGLTGVVIMALLLIILLLLCEL